MSACDSPRCEQGFLCPACKAIAASAFTGEPFLEPLCLRAEAFHAHFDACSQCPIELCAEGARLLAPLS